MRFLIITGMSGAGKSLAVRYLEDIGFFCVDNLPPSLVPKFAEFCFQSEGKMENVAVVMDIRSGDFLRDLLPALDELSKNGQKYEILFLEASDKTLIKRYKASRRLHPLSHDDRLIISIKAERRILQELKNKADHILDTSILEPKQFKQELEGIFVEGKEFKGIVVNILSFGFKYGIPLDSDLVFDVRFLPNPYYVDSLREYTGKKESVRDYVLSFEQAGIFLGQLEKMLDFLMPNYINEGKSQLVISIGCTGGKHRSVTIADQLYQILSGKKYKVVIDHRDITKEIKQPGKKV